MDADAVYQLAVRKLRTLIAASEAASSMEDDEAGSLSGVEPLRLNAAGEEGGGRQGLTDPPPLVRRRFKKNTTVSSGARRSLFGGGGGGSAATGASDRERHNSWHNLLHIDASSGGGGRGDELALLAKQERYIKQLEGETAFCREQLSFVLANVKDVLAEKRAAAASEEVSHAISNVFNTIQGWQQHQVKAGGDHADSLPSAEAAKLRKDNSVLTEGVKKLREELEEVRRREEEAAEQVKSSIQVAEQLRMEKSEADYEISQLKLQGERQQAKIRALIEEQLARVEEERAVIEARCQEQVRQAREEQSKTVEECARLSVQVEQLQRTEVELRRQVKDRDDLMGDVKKETEKRLGQLQMEAARTGAARQDLERQNSVLAMEAEQARQDMKAEVGRAEAEAKAVRSRLGRAEQALATSRQEALEMAEERAALEREVGMLRNVDRSTAGGGGMGGKDSLNNSLSDNKKVLSQAVTVAKFEDMIRRQSRIIGELRQQCHLVTDRLEETARALEEERRVGSSGAAEAKSREASSRRRAQEAEARLEERGRLHRKLCQKIEEMDLTQGRLQGELRRAQLACEEMRQERAMAEQEAAFLREKLMARGMLPERDDHLDEEKQRRSKKSPSLSKPRAVVVERNGELIAPPITK